MIRKITPILVVIAAIAVYIARGALLGPFTPGDPPPDRQLQSAGMSAQLDFGLSQAEGTTADPGGYFESPGSDSAEDPTIADLPPNNNAAQPIAGKIQKNSSLYVEMRKMGISPAEIEGVSRASRKVHDLRKVRPGQKFSVYATPAGTVDSLVFFIDEENCLKVRREANAFTANVDTIPYTVTYHVTQGTIRQSVFASLLEQRVETELASSLDQIFGWTIDFITDIRRGDAFVILFERKTFQNGKSTLGDVLSAKVTSRGQEYHAFRFKPRNGSVGYYDLTGKSLEKSLRRAPLKFTRVTSNFSGRRFHPVNRRYQPHWGVDYGAPRGTPVHATGDGLVLAATRRAGNGNYVKIKHNGTYTTYYLHLSRFARGVRSGTRVKQGQVIGYVGSTGSATGPHVCYRIKRNGSWVNPRKLELPSKKPVSDAEMARFGRLRDACLLRMTETLMAGADNQTTDVKPPSVSSDGRIPTIF